MPIPFVGFYWTLPVYRIGFNPTPEEAAAKSKTVRYQIARIQEYAREQGGEIIDSITFIEVRPDRATDAVRECMARALKLCGGGRATLLYVEFWQQSHWRRHSHLLKYLSKHRIKSEPVPVTTMTIDGRPFHPTQHFQRWRKLDQSESVRLRNEARLGIQALAIRTQEGPGFYKRIANDANAQGLKTATGRPWTAANVTKALKRHGESS